jgi:hypothetical protein
MNSRGLSENDDVAHQLSVHRFGSKKIKNWRRRELVHIETLLVKRVHYTISRLTLSRKAIRSCVKLTSKYKVLTRSRLSRIQCFKERTGGECGIFGQVPKL